MRPADVVVIGGGVIGSAVAYYAARRGLQVLLVDQPKRGRATSASAGGLWSIGESVGLGCGVIFHKRQTARSPALASGDFPGAVPSCFFRFAMASNALYPALVEELRERSGVDVEWKQTSLLFLLYDDGDRAFAEFVQQRLPGAEGLMQWLSPEELARDEPAVTPDTQGAVRFLGDDQVNPYRLADALRASAQSLGARVVARAEVTGILLDHGKVQGVRTSEGDIPCLAVVNAAGAWAGQVGRMVGLDIPIRPVRGQIFGTETLPPDTIRACLSTSDCYLAQKGHGEIIVGSTTEEVGFATGITTDALQSLAAGAVRTVPLLKDTLLKRTWSGLRPGTPDELPILGPVAGIDGYFNACGHFRTGILNAPLTGQVLAEMIEGQTPAIPMKPYTLERFAH